VEAKPDSPETLERFHASLALVDAIAGKVARSLNRRVEVDELKSWGQEGLLEASRRFDPAHGVPFRAYASYRVRGAMIDGVRKDSALPRRVHEKLRMMDAADRYAEDSAAELLSAPPPGETRKDAARLLDDHLARMATAMAAGLVGKAAVGEDGQLTAVDTGRSPEDSLEFEQLRALLHEQVEALPAEEAELVRRHYFDGERFDHVARDLGLSKSWASRLHTRAIGRLTKRLRQQV
jgi:RNA polymerase sigma factor for flagellar operon FliA